MKLLTIAIDDEPLALELLVSYIERTPGVHLVAKFSSAIQALEYIHQSTVDLIFLDIRMPDLNGIELAKIIDQKKGVNKPRIVFTTAYDDYALEGFRVDALDYLLKPFNYVDFSLAVQKAVAYFMLLRNAAQPSFSPDLTTAGNQLIDNGYDDPFLYLRVDHQMVKVEKAKIVYVEGLKDYVKIFVEDQAKPMISLLTLKSLEAKLSSKNFMRLHRSYIVSLDRVTAVTKSSVYIDEQHFSVSEGYREAFEQFLARWK
ncbi:LytTR family DNA-binding domain-containing protein [Sphingobacterium oryzagri]|uniref:LytTR family DNA-binding domain-containing protein n=1 Tax=Sphingobacterium oryzagri TaxID=3025669 RepID=A0ABY7WIT3_9SPHI|nr:LytTR family DNA-binding domain-containing protein [Sphingobacterium sp. KACC 22765]WDF68457.1 LytTR family DNA-binding domain-containing protein [Sphingobacterium sp. KACC 22765]